MLGGKELHGVTDTLKATGPEFSDTSMQISARGILHRGVLCDPLREARLLRVLQTVTETSESLFRMAGPSRGGRQQESPREGLLDSLLVLGVDLCRPFPSKLQVSGLQGLLEGLLAQEGSNILGVVAAIEPSLTFQIGIADLC